MEMTEVFDKLKDLQEILSQKYEIENIIEETPKRLSNQEELLERYKKEYIEKNAEYEEVKSKVNKLKLELDEAVASREAGEKGMDNISTHREYEALDKQITEAKARETDLRKDLQVEEKNFAELDETLKTIEAAVKDQEASLNEAKSSVDKELNDYKKQLTKLEKKEADVTPGIDQEIVYKFQRIIQRNSMGIVAVKNGVCDGCHMILPAQFANEVHDGEKILFCPYCSRILYYEEVKDGEESFNFEIGSLADLDDDDESEIIDDEEMEYEDEEEEDSWKDGDSEEDDEDADLDDEIDEEEDEEESEE